MDPMGHYPCLWGIKQCECMMIFKDFTFNSELGRTLLVVVWDEKPGINRLGIEIQTISRIQL